MKANDPNTKRTQTRHGNSEKHHSDIPETINIPLPKEFKKPEDHTCDDIAAAFCRLLQKELSFRRKAGMSVQPLRLYLSNLFEGQNTLLPLGVAGYGQRLAPILDLLRKSKKRLTVCDAGCGYGTESLLFALLGMNVTGIELVSERCDLALSRIDFYNSICETRLKIDFRNVNAFPFLMRSDTFDVIWAMEAISHIYPPEKFLDLAYSKLNKGGRLIISDPNKINPLAWLRSVRIRGSLSHAPHTRFLDPETRQPVEYGQEKIYSARTMKKILIESGFHPERIHISGFLGSNLLPKTIARNPRLTDAIKRMPHIIRKLPVFRGLGSLYTIVAQKR